MLDSRSLITSPPYFRSVLEIMQNIGQLFLLRTNINSVGSVLDSPVCATSLIYVWDLDYI